MATVECVGTDLIGATAGEVWHCLAAEGQMSLSRLAKEIEQPRDIVMQAVGWLAREDKVELQETSRGRVISLR